MGLETQCKKFAIVLNVPKGYELDLYEKKLQKYCEETFIEYAFIKHDKDTTASGVLKVLHYHLLGMTEKRKRISTMINDIAEEMAIDRRLVSCKKCVSYTGAIQYLIHKNDLDKYQYKINDIFTNIPSEDLQMFMEEDNDNITIDRLIFVVKHSKSLTDIIKQIGLSHYLGYRNVIKDLWNERYLQND